MHAFVTGATGLLGNTLVRLLVEDGHDVRALVRSAAKADRVLGDVDVDVVVGDVTDVGAFEAALDGVDVVFHTAAYFREYYAPGDHRERLRRVNVDATVDLLAAAERRGVDRVVHVSSSGVIGAAPDGGPGTETDLLAPEATPNDYFRSKILAEAAVDDYLATHDLDVVRVLPGWLLGPGDAAPTAGGRLLVDLARGSLPGLFDGGEHVTDVRDAAAAIVVAAERGVPGARYLVAGPYRTLAELAGAVETVTGVPAPRRLPRPVVAVAAAVGDVYGRLTGRPVRLTTAAVHSLRPDRRVDSGRAVADLDATFRPLDETVADAVAWFAANGYLDDAPEVVRRVTAGRRDATPA